MALFGRRANQQSTKPEVPPELRPYYDGTSRGARLRHAAGRLAPLLIAIILAGAIIAGAVWWRDNHKTTPSNKTASNSQSKKNNPGTQSSQPSGTPNSPAPTTPDNQPSPGASSASSGPQTSSTSTTTPSVAANPPSGSSATPANGQAASMPNTGPDERVLIAALAASALGTAGFYRRQLRRLSH